MGAAKRMALVVCLTALVSLCHAQTQGDNEDGADPPAWVGELVATMTGSEWAVPAALGERAQTRPGPADLRTYCWFLEDRTRGGIIGEWSVTVVGPEPALRGLSCRHRRRPPSSTWVAWDDAHECAVAYAAQLGALLWTEPGLEETPVSRQPQAETDAYRFEFVRANAPQAAVTVLVNAFSGRVCGCDVVSCQGSSACPPEPPDLRVRALALLADTLAARGLPPPTEDRILWESRAARPTDEGWKWAWRANLFVDDWPAEDRGLVSYADVSVILGGDTPVYCDVDRVPVAWARYAREHNVSVGAAELALRTAPEWVANDIEPMPLGADGSVVFRTARPYQGCIPWRQHPQGIGIAPPPPDQACRLYTRQHTCEQLSASLRASFVAYGYREEVGLLNVASGRRWLLGTPRVESPSEIAACATRPAFVGRVFTARGDARWLAFVADDTDKLERTPLTGLDATDVRVAFAPDDARAAVIRASGNPGEEEVTLQLLSVSPDFAFTERRMVTQLDVKPPASLSWFLDGVRVLVGWPGGGLIVDTETAAVTPLALPALVDPDTASVLQIAPSSFHAPGDDRVVFCARGEDWPPERGARIYSCKLDGSEVKRLTPLDDDPIPRWVFPQTGEVAFKMPWEE